MRTAGIVAEFNPFHGGHAHLIAAAKRELGEGSAVVCAMSGSAVQRGEFAAFGKYARAEAAVRCGADLVLELPCPWSLGSAERFAGGAVGLLEHTGVVDTLYFGSECGDLARIEETASALLRPEMDGLIKDELSAGAPYAAARQRALERLVGARADIITRPNNILAVEYVKALLRTGSRIRPCTVRRKGAEHDGQGESVLPSASWLRSRLMEGADISAYVPEAAGAVYQREIAAGRGPVGMQQLEQGILARLRMLRAEDFEALPDAAEGLGRRLFEAVRTQPTAADVLCAAKTKRYAHARLRRMLMCAVLGIGSADAEGAVPYIKILAMSETGKALSRRMRSCAGLPVLIRPSAVRELGEREKKVFLLESSAADFRALACAEVSQRTPGADWRASPFVVSGKNCAKGL